MFLDRKVDISTDFEAEIHHKFEAKLIRSYCKGKKVLDIGCWTGQFLSILNISNTDRFGLDPNELAIEFAKNHRPGIYLVGSALKLPFKDNFFDVVTMWDVIEHIPRNTELIALSEAKRVMRKGGIFALSTVTTHPISIIMDPAFFLLGHRHYSKKRLFYLLEGVGFKVEETIYAGGLWTLIRENIGLIGKHILHGPVNLNFLNKLSENEYQGKGFYQIHIISKKL